MPPLERLFLLEVEFHRRLRTQAPATADPGGLHTKAATNRSYARPAPPRPTTSSSFTTAARDTLKKLLSFSQLDN